MVNRLDKLRKACNGFAITLLVFACALGLIIIFEIFYVGYAATVPSSSFGMEVEYDTFYEDLGEEIMEGKKLNHITIQGKKALINSTYELHYSTETLKPNYKASFIISSTAIIFSQLFIVVILYLASLVLKIKQDVSPFNEKNVSRLKAIGALIIFATIIPHFLEMMLNFFVFLNAEGFIAPMSWMMILVGFAITSIAYMFEYGVFLQEEFDQTL